jgi:putative ABC transport system permease protein
MLKNYLRIAWRNVCKQKGYAFINVFGLAIGLAFCALVFLYVRDEFTFDRFHRDHDRIYRVSHPSFDENGRFTGMYPYQPVPLGAAMKAEVPEVEEYVRFYESQHVIRSGTEVVQEKLLFADPSVLTVFTFPLLRGNPATALATPNSIVLSETMAEKYFSGQEPLGKLLNIRLGNRFEVFTVTGIAQTIPANSSIRFDLLAPIANLPTEARWDMNDWRVVRAITYVRLASGSKAMEVEQKLIPFRRLHYPWEAEEKRQGRPPVRFTLEPITETHLNTWTIGGLVPANDPLYSYMLAGIALLVLAVACINYMTLAIGRSAKRAGEVAVRKVVGAVRAQLMTQFWGEALPLTLLALFLGMVLAELCLPAFSALVAKELKFDYFRDALTIPALLVLMLITGLVAGSYPALVLSRIKPVEVVKRKFRLSGANTLGKVLIVVQFALSIFLIASSIVILHQLQYMRDSSPGFNKERVAVIPSTEMQSIFANAADAGRVLSAYRDDLRTRSDVVGVTAVRRPPSLTLSSASIQRHLAAGYHENVALEAVDSSFVRVLDLTIVAGRTFDPNLPGDRVDAVLINETMARRFGWSEPVGQSLAGILNRSLLDSIPNPTVVGIVKDFHTRPLHFPVQPLMMTLNEKVAGQLPNRHLLIRIAAGDVSSTLSSLQVVWQRIAPDIPFTYSFLDDELQRQYHSEDRLGRVVTYAAVFAILIACIGLLGIVALAVAERTKEIGIRKVLGASVTRVTYLVCKDYVRLTALAALLALPVAYFTMRSWLEHFAYHVPLSFSVMVLACVLVVMAALLTVSYQAIKTALSDPVKALRYE